MREKRVTDPIGEKIKARLRGDGCCLAGTLSSSRSSSVLSGFVDGLFFFSDDEDVSGPAVREWREQEGTGSEGTDGEDGRFLPPAAVVTTVRYLLKPSSGFGRDLIVDATEAAETLAGLRRNRPAFQRAVMSSLRASGYDAGICNAKWERRGSLIAGDHGYIDVVTPPPPPSTHPFEPPPPQQQRYIVILEFATEFEIARPTAEYGGVVAELPPVYAGKTEELKRLLRVLADSGKRSMRAREMQVPPWRKNSYMQRKWLGPFRRAVDPAPSGAASPATAGRVPSLTRGREVNCRRVGFDVTTQFLSRAPSTGAIDMSR